MRGCPLVASTHTTPHAHMRGVTARHPSQARPLHCSTANTTSTCRGAAHRRTVAAAAASPSPTSPSSAQRGMDVGELSVTADLIRRSQSTDEQLAAALAGAAQEGPDALLKQPWVQTLIAANPALKLVFSAHGNTADTKQHLSTGLSGDHLFLSLLQNDMLNDMLVLYDGAASHQRILTVLRLGVPVCGHPTIVHGGLISAVFDEVFGICLFAAGRYGHMELGQVFTAHLAVDFKAPVPAEATIVCDASVESCERRKIWLTAKLTDPSGDKVYASSRALFVKPRDDAAAQPSPPVDGR